MVTVAQVKAETVNNEFDVTVNGVAIAIDYFPSTHSNIEEEASVYVESKLHNYEKQYTGAGALEKAVKYANSSYAKIAQ